MSCPRMAAAFWVAGAALLGCGGPLTAQQGPAPLIRLDEVGGAALSVTPPAGWALYAPDRPGGEKPEAGLALEVRGYPGGRTVAVSGPEPLLEITAAGSVQVYRARTRLRMPALPDAVRELEVRWAICRGDLCIPGRTRVTRNPT